MIFIYIYLFGMLLALIGFSMCGYVTDGLKTSVVGIIIASILWPVTCPIVVGMQLGILIKLLMKKRD